VRKMIRDHLNLNCWNNAYDLTYSCFLHSLNLMSNNSSLSLSLFQACRML
jgi:hypothetical protein